MKQIGAFFQRVTSRKLLITLFGMGMVYLKPEIATPIGTLVGIYVAGEGAADAVSRYSTEKTKQVEAKACDDPELLGDEDDDIDTSLIIPGVIEDPSEEVGGIVPM